MYLHLDIRHGTHMLKSCTADLTYMLYSRVLHTALTCEHSYSSSPYDLNDNSFVGIFVFWRCTSTYMQLCRMSICTSILHSTWYRTRVERHTKARYPGDAVVYFEQLSKHNHRSDVCFVLIDLVYLVMHEFLSRATTKCLGTAVRASAASDTSV